MNLTSRYSRRAFTLIELLVVIAIIAILMGLLIPSVNGVLENAKKVQAKNDATQIATAVIAYETEYGKLPGTSGGGDVAQANPSIMDILMPPNPTSPPAENPRGIIFLEIPEAKGGKNGRAGNSGPFLDSWGSAYTVVIDGNYDNSVSAGGDTVRKRVAVFSPGKDKNAGTNDDVKSWQ